MNNRTDDPLKDAYLATKAILDVFSTRLPSGFWDDPFVLGFIYFSVHAYALIASATGDDFKRLPAVYSQLLEGDAPSVIARSAALHKAKDPDFILGMEKADMFTSALRGVSKYDDEEAVIRAHELARKLIAEDPERGDPAATFTEALYVYLHDGIFASEIRRRFPEMAERLN